MHADILDIEHAATSLIDSIFYEEERLAELEAELQQRLADQKSRGQLYTNVMSDPHADTDDVLAATGAYWDAYDEGPKIEEVERTVDTIQHAIDLRRTSTEALAGSLLQLGRNLIASNYRHVRTAPAGRRKLGSQDLKTVIWQGRNQATHHSDASAYHQPVLDCFNKLASEIDSAFALGAKPDQNHAYRLVKLLGWTEFQAFADDMDSLL